MTLAKLQLPLDFQNITRIMLPNLQNNVRYYDFERSTEENYADDNAAFGGKYGHLRSKLDYSYHSKYCLERQMFQDTLIDSFYHTIIYDGENTCEAPLENWLVFTAGPMGAGKTHTLQWLKSKGYFPLEAFVRVDPDVLREKLPEMITYNERNPMTAGILTQKEVGYISEVMTLRALEEGKNVIVDGSLRDHSWYKVYIRSLKEKFPKLKIGIIEIDASVETVLRLVKSRGDKSGRSVPEQVILDAISKIPDAIKHLTELSDYVCTINNDDRVEEEFTVGSKRVERRTASEPVLVYSNKHDTSWESFQEVFTMRCAYNPQRSKNRNDASDAFQATKAHPADPVPTSVSSSLTTSVSSDSYSSEDEDHNPPARSTTSLETC